jgi:hypothetical protein
LRKLDQVVIVDSRAARPLAQGLSGSPQQQQLVHAQVDRPITMVFFTAGTDPASSFS